MKNWLKLVVVGIFAFAAVGFFVNDVISGAYTKVSAQTDITPSPTAPPPAGTPTPEPPKAEEKKIPKDFILSADSFSEYGPSPFDHETHAFQKYSPDGKSVVGCVECHHTDQPKSSLKPPLLTSERDVVMTMEIWQKSPQKVARCRDCHFQKNLEPDGKEMPTATYKDGEKETVKILDNEVAYHINCNTCHDAAVLLRPELKGKKGFATGKDCFICHEEQ